MDFFLLNIKSQSSTRSYEFNFFSLDTLNTIQHLCPIFNTVFAYVTKSMKIVLVFLQCKQHCKTRNSYNLDKCNTSSLGIYTDHRLYMKNWNNWRYASWRRVNWRAMKLDHTSYEENLCIIECTKYRNIADFMFSLLWYEV